MQEVERDKVRFEIGKVLSKQIGEPKVYGWGNNKQGQLGIYGFNNVHEPKQIPLPEINSNDTLFINGGKAKDYIVSIECGKRHSAFITKNGQLWITGNYVQEKVPANSVTGRKESFDGSELSKDDIKVI